MRIRPRIGVTHHESAAGILQRHACRGIHGRLGRHTRPSRPRRRRRRHVGMHIPAIDQHVQQGFLGRRRQLTRAGLRRPGGPLRAPRTRAGRFIRLRGRQVGQPPPVRCLAHIGRGLSGLRPMPRHVTRQQTIGQQPLRQRAAVWERPVHVRRIRRCALVFLSGLLIHQPARRPHALGIRHGHQPLAGLQRPAAQNGQDRHLPRPRMQPVAAIAHNVPPQVVAPAQGVPAVLGIAHLAPVRRQHRRQHVQAPGLHLIQVAQKAALETDAVGNAHGHRHHDTGRQYGHEQLETYADSHAA